MELIDYDLLQGEWVKKQQEGMVAIITQENEYPHDYHVTMRLQRLRKDCSTNPKYYTSLHQAQKDLRTLRELALDSDHSQCPICNGQVTEKRPVA